MHNEENEKNILRNREKKKQQQSKLADCTNLQAESHNIMSLCISNCDMELC